uniref:oleoyl-[acyl-carrier-protein] hydrolase n=1 Tax=Timema tahoe TaxID=61484 RepID=A0A7R9FI45_9NEOP|nr:unnamed protein product [Timema tahoe]
MESDSNLETVPSQQSLRKGPETSSRVCEGSSLECSRTDHLSQCCVLDRLFTVSFGVLTFEEKQQAYHGMIQAAELSSTETVLIHAGHTSIGQAAIALALNKGSTVFTTVAESNHKEFLIKRFPQLQENNILSLKSNFDISLMRATKGVGVKVIVNCLRGSKLQSSLHCVAECGRFVQLGTADMEENTNIGMFMFLKNTTIFGIVLDSIFNASFAWRKEMHSAIQKGIKCGIVQPFERTIFTKQNILAALRELSNSNYVGKVVLTLEKEDNTNKNSFSNSEENTTSLVVDAKDSHLIIGTKFEHCLDLAEWLVARKASKITIASRSPRISALSERRLFLLHQYHGAHIVQSSADVLSTLTGAMSLIRSSLNLGPLKTIFVISLNDATSLHNLDVASRSLASLSHFVSLINSSADISESRFKAGLPILDVQWANNKKLESIRPVIRSLNQLLGKNTPTYVYMYVQDELIKDAKEDSSFDELVNFLPSSIEELEGVGFHFMSKSKSPLVLASSLSTGIGHVPEVMPIFIIPGIQDCIKKHSDHLSKNLMYPTVYIELQDHMCLQDSSAIIVKQMRNIQPVGPYNLVGVSWGGILAIELARELQSQDQKIQLFLLDGAPDTTQSIAKLLGTGDELQCNLITRLLGIESNKVTLIAK